MPDKPKIMIVDDEVLVAMALGEDLEQNGFEISGPFGNADAAAESLERDLPSAAFLDVNLGRGRTSFALAAALRERGIPFAFLTGYSSVDRLDEFPGARLIGKPVAPARAVAEAQRLLGEAP